MDLLLRAAAVKGDLRVVVAGDGPNASGWRTSRTSRPRRPPRFAGRWTSTLVDLYADFFAVYYAPVDEDYGLSPTRRSLEAGE